MSIHSQVIKTQDGVQLRAVECMPGTTEKHAALTIGQPKDPDVFGSHARIEIGVALVNPNGAQPRSVQFYINETQAVELARRLLGDRYHVSPRGAA